MAMRILLGVFVSIVIFCALTLPVFAQYMPSGGPDGRGASIYDGARTMYNKDGDLDSRIENYMAKVRKGSVTYEDTKYRLSEYKQEARSRVHYWESTFSSSQDPSVFRAIESMLQLQSERCNELYDATVYEQTNGLEAAKPKWQMELETYNSYKSAVRKVKNML
jgi:hypothetical protein